MQVRGEDSIKHIELVWKIDGLTRKVNLRKPNDKILDQTWRW